MIISCLWLFKCLRNLSLQMKAGAANYDTSSAISIEHHPSLPNFLPDPSLLAVLSNALYYAPVSVSHKRQNLAKKVTISDATTKTTTKLIDKKKRKKEKKLRRGF